MGPTVDLQSPQSYASELQAFSPTSHTGDFLNQSPSSQEGPPAQMQTDWNHQSPSSQKDPPSQMQSDSGHIRATPNLSPCLHEDPPAKTQLPNPIFGPNVASPCVATEKQETPEKSSNIEGLPGDLFVDLHIDQPHQQVTPSNQPVGNTHTMVTDQNLQQGCLVNHLTTYISKWPHLIGLLVTYIVW
ncbi:hypothetical protein AAC387_Pa08g0813 [Persea americana]